MHRKGCTTFRTVTAGKWDWGSKPPENVYFLNRSEANAAKYNHALDPAGKCLVSISLTSAGKESPSLHWITALPGGHQSHTPCPYPTHKRAPAAGSSPKPTPRASLG